MIATAWVLLIQCKSAQIIEPCSLFTVSIKLEGTYTLIAEPEDGAPPYMYSWSTGATTGSITANTAGIYTVTVWDDNACEVTESFNFSPDDDCGITSILDADGNLYDVVTIGGRCWMVQNMSKHSGIAEKTADTAWAGSFAPSWCNYDNSALNGAAYGKLYNWYAIEGGAICPDGWHVPTKEEWDALIAFLGGNAVAGGKMKSTSALWDPPNTGADNSSGFDALPGGYRAHLGVFFDIKKTTVFWTSTTNPGDTTTAYTVTLSTNSAFASVAFSDKNSGYSCRCVKDP